MPQEDIADFSKELEKEGIIAHYFETDLTKKENIIDLSDWANKYPISVLINNAGCSGSKNISDASVDYLEMIIQLNITATSLLTKLLLPNLTRQPKSYILNVSSMAAFSPMAYKTVYPASKKFIQYFSQGLNEELRERNVSVSVIYPGPMKTNENVTKRIEKQSKFVNAGVVSLEAVAKKAIKGLFKEKQMIVPGKINQLSRWLLRILPLKIKVPLVSKAIKKELNAR